MHATRTVVSCVTKNMQHGHSLHRSVCGWGEERVTKGLTGSTHARLDGDYRACNWGLCCLANTHALCLLGSDRSGQRRGLVSGGRVWVGC